jgi:hypothetical protein
VAQPSNLTVLWRTAANPACRLWSWAATLHRLLSTTSSCFSCYLAVRTWPCWPPGRSSWAYLSLHSSEAPQDIDLSRPLVTCNNANQVASCTCNTQPRVSPHRVVNHSSQPGATIHRSSDAPVPTSVVSSVVSLKHGVDENESKASFFLHPLCWLSCLVNKNSLCTPINKCEPWILILEPLRTWREFT